MIRIEFKKDEEKVALLKAIASSNPQESLAAQTSLAAFVGPIVQSVIQTMAISTLIYRDFTYNFDTEPSIPLDLFDGNKEGLIDIWSSTVAGGLATNLIHGMSDFRFMTYDLNSAVSMLKKYARDARVDVIAKALERMAQELLIKQEYNAFNVLLSALANSQENAGKAHLLDATTGDVFQVDDLNRLLTLSKRLRSSWTGGTPATKVGSGVTDILVSPEIVEQIRSFSYQPMNTRAVPNTDESTALGLPDAVRTRFFDSAGIPEIWGIGVHEVFELGVAKPYTALFDALYTAGSGEPGFDAAADDLVLGFDLSTDFAVRAISTAPDSSSTVNVLVDDQFVNRSRKWGWYAEMTEGRIVTDVRSCVGLVV